MNRRNFFQTLGVIAGVASVAIPLPAVASRPTISNEYERCKRDPAYFIENYVKHAGPEGPRTLPLQSWQKTAISQFQVKQGVLGMLPRQVGKTTLIQGLILHSLVFGDSKTNIAYATFTSLHPSMKGIRETYDRLPEWMKKKIVIRNLRRFELETGACLTMCSSVTATRGHRFSDVYLDEIAFCRPNGFGEFWTAAYPAFDEARFMVLSTPSLSTFNGQNAFHDAYQEALKNPEWYAFQTEFVYKQ